MSVIGEPSGFGNSGTFVNNPVSLGMNETGCRALSKDECDRILAAFDGRNRLRNRLIFILGEKTGYRVSEILSLKVSSVFSDGKVNKNMTVLAAWMKGKKKSRTMPINPAVADALVAYLRHTHMDHPVFSDFPLFPAQGSRKAMTSRQVFDIIIEAAERAGVSTERLGTHSMRKTFATSLWNHPSIGHDLVKMAKALGHQNYNNTLRYLEFLDNSVEAAVLSI